MRAATYLRKYEEYAAIPKDAPIKHKKSVELNRILVNLAKRWYELNVLDSKESFKEWEAGWRTMQFVFSLSPNGTIKLHEYASDFSFARGNTSTFVKTHTIRKKELFNQ